MSRCVGISAARRDSSSAGRRVGLPKAVGSADADADGLCAAAGACGGDSGDLTAAGGLPQKRSPGGNSGDLRPVPTGQHHPVQPAGAGAVRPADAAAAVRRRIGATGISPAGGRGGRSVCCPVWGPGCCGPARPILCEKRGVYREFLAAACKIHTKTAMAASCVSVNRRARPRAS